MFRSAGPVQQGQVLAGKLAALLAVTPGFSPEPDQFAFKFGKPGREITHWYVASARGLDLVEDVPVRRVERIAAASGLARNRCWRDPNDAAAWSGCRPSPRASLASAAL